MAFQALNTDDVPILEQHAFLDLAKEYDWNAVKQAVTKRPALARAQPCGRDGTKRWTALHQAAFCPNEDAVNFLLRCKADPDARNNAGDTPLDVAKNDNVMHILRKFIPDAPAIGPALRNIPRPLQTRLLVLKAMKASRGKKAMEATKVSRSKVAKGKRGKALVFKGCFEKTKGGLTKDSLIRSKAGKIVSKKKQAHGKKAYAKIKGWVEAFMRARVELGLTGFVAVKKDSPLYVKTKQLYQL